MTSIPVAKCRYSGNNFKRFYLKKKTILSIFDCISEMCMKFRTFWKKKEEYPSLITTEIIASERYVYLTIQKVLLQHTIRKSTC